MVQSSRNTLLIRLHTVLCRAALFSGDALLHVCKGVSQAANSASKCLCFWLKGYFFALSIFLPSLLGPSRGVLGGEDVWLDFSSLPVL